MMILSVTVVPFFHARSVYTAYEYLERRFDAKTRSLTSLLFLLVRAAVVRRHPRRAGGGALDRARLDPAGDRARDRRCRLPSTR